jgi:hypothetical protein
VTISNEPPPITRNITITEASFRCDPPETGIGLDLIARLLAKGVFATINQTPTPNWPPKWRVSADTEVITEE